MRFSSYFAFDCQFCPSSMRHVVLFWVNLLNLDDNSLVSIRVLVFCCNFHKIRFIQVWQLHIFLLWSHSQFENHWHILSFKWLTIQLNIRRGASHISVHEIIYSYFWDFQQDRTYQLKQPSKKVFSWALCRLEPLSPQTHSYK